MKSISVFGLGYVGAVTAACLAHAGHHVIAVDVQPAKVAMLESGQAPVLEPGLAELIAEGRNSGRLEATTDTTLAVMQSDISFICVGTPGLRNGQLDVSIVARTCQQIGRALAGKDKYHCIVLRSTVLPGTTESVAVPALAAASGKRPGTDFAVCVNPEFTREGSAVDDFLHAAITVLGAEHPAHLRLLREVYDGSSAQILESSVAVAEMVKYVCNAFHALKVAFANEVGELCKQLQVDPGAVFRIFISDTKLNISPAYLSPGFAFGGSCLPKDLRALSYRARQVDLDLPLLRAILPSNQAHLERAAEAVLATKCKKIGFLGLSFKSGTDDLRESPSVQLIKRLLGEGRQLQIWDADVSLGRVVGSNRQFIEDELPHIGTMLSTNLEDVITHADVVVIGTNAVDDNIVAALLRPDQGVIDLRSKPRFVQRSIIHEKVNLAPEPTLAELGALACEAA